MNIEPKIFASKTHLKRYWTLNNRIMAYDSATQMLRNKKFDPNKFCIVIVERFLQGNWIDQIYFIPKHAHLSMLYRKIIGDSK